MSFIRDLSFSLTEFETGETKTMTIEKFWVQQKVFKYSLKNIFFINLNWKIFIFCSVLT